jgi:hypothetical protein
MVASVKGSDTPSPESLRRLADFARGIVTVPKADVDAKIREERQERKATRKKTKRGARS